MIVGLSTELNGQDQMHHYSNRDSMFVVICAFSSKAIQEVCKHFVDTF